MSGAEKRVLSSVFVCCLWVFAVPAGARAATAFGTATCSVQSVTMMGMTVWQIKGTTSVTGLDPGDNTVSVTVSFQKKAKGATGFTEFSTVTQATRGVGGTATIDTGFIGFTPDPASGDQYDISVTGTYMTGPPAKNNALALKVSLPITPVP